MSFIQFVRWHNCVFVRYNIEKKKINIIQQKERLSSVRSVRHRCTAGYNRGTLTSPSNFKVQPRGHCRAWAGCFFAACCFCFIHQTRFYLTDFNSSTREHYSRHWRTNSPERFRPLLSHLFLFLKERKMHCFSITVECFRLLDVCL